MPWFKRHAPSRNGGKGEKLDTRSPTSKLMLTILAGVATWEREIMLERQREGIAKAKDEGKYKGCPASIDAAHIKALVAAGGRPAQIARDMGIARSGVYRMLEKRPQPSGMSGGFDPMRSITPRPRSHRQTTCALSA